MKGKNRMYKFGLRKSLINIIFFVIALLFPIYTYVFEIEDRFAYVFVPTIIIMSVITIFTLLFKVYVAVLESAFEYKEYSTFKNNKKIGNILEIANVVLFLIGSMMCIYEKFFVFALICLYLNTLSVGLVFMLNRYIFLLNSSSIIFMGKERYINIKLKNIKSIKTKALNKKVMITITTQEGEWSIYTFHKNTKAVIEMMKSDRTDMYVETQ